MKLKSVLAALAMLILVPLAVVHGALRASLPKLDRTLIHIGVVAPVTINRDALGVPTIEAANRVDLAYGTGFVHGQDRFFEMDLSRRLAAGELAEVFGDVALEQDRKARIFRFRQVAREALGQASPEQRAVLEAYTRGVNAGLASLHSRPWEYWLLGSAPVKWHPEDSILVSHAMWWDLQYSGLKREIERKEVNAHLGGAECLSGWRCNLQFFYPSQTEWDAPNAADKGADPEKRDPDVSPEVGPTSAAHDGTTIPSPDVLDVRSASASVLTSSRALAPPELTEVHELRDLGIGDWRDTGMSGLKVAPLSPRAESAAGDFLRSDIGSNNWAVAGRLTTTGAALVANDMHLRSRVPAVWYRARLRIAGTATQEALDLNGVTLPGTPLLVAGSNGHIAWGFTNSYGDWYHVKRVACIAVGEKDVQTASGPVPLTVQNEEIRVRGSPSVMLPVMSGPAGVLLEAHPDRRTCWFATWLAQQPSATNMSVISLERVTSVKEALDVAPTLGIPHQNLVVGDQAGHIAWTIAGRVPLDTGDNRTNGTSDWTGPETHPHIMDPKVGRIWTANARATDDPEQEAAIGGNDTLVGADYDLGARVRQIRDDLLAIKGPAAPADMLRIQLDDRAIFLTRWQTLLTGLLDADSVAGHPGRAQFRHLVADWNARASVDSVGYRLVRTYHERTQKVVWDMMVNALQLTAVQPMTVPDQFEPALWQLVTSQPVHMLSARYQSWRQFLLAQVDATMTDLQVDCPDLARCTWGSHKPVSIRHPLSASLPFLASVLDMPTVELPGDHDMPRVQDGPMGASERFAVSPGHEDQGYIHLPGGQSGHPLSPFYKAGFLDWARGTPTPFLPGPSQHRLTLQPE